ncbi:MAG: hypothetical protein WBD74_06205 [Candidatus Aquilonibacter sp.]
MLYATVLIAALATGQPVGPHHVGCNVNEIFTEHIHAHLAIEQSGTTVSVPANIGMVSAGSTMVCIYWLHTHDDTGTIHIEAPGGNYTLADFFAVWGQPLSRTRVGPYSGRVRAYVNGAPYKGAPQTIPLVDGEQITLQI